MKTFMILSVILGLGFFSVGCETSHSETDRDTITGGHKHTETTTTENPITGDTHTTHTEQVTH